MQKYILSSFSFLYVLSLFLPVLVVAQSDFPCELEVEQVSGSTYKIGDVDGSSYCDDVLEDFGITRGEEFLIDPAIAAYYGGGDSFLIGFNKLDDEEPVALDDYSISSVFTKTKSSVTYATPQTTSTESDTTELTSNEEAKIALQLQIIDLLTQIIDLLTQRIASDA